jgi:hypothetical protein
MLIEEEGYVGIKIEETYCVSGYSSLNVGLNILMGMWISWAYSLGQLHKEVIITGDVNAKFKVWGGTKTDRRGKKLSEVLDRNHFAPIGIWDGSTFQRGCSRSFLDVMSVSGKLLEKHRRSVVLEDYTVPRITDTYCMNFEAGLCLRIWAFLSFQRRTLYLRCF